MIYKTQYRTLWFDQFETHKEPGWYHVLRRVSSFCFTSNIRRNILVINPSYGTGSGGAYE